MPDILLQSQAMLCAIVAAVVFYGILRLHEHFSKAEPPIAGKIEHRFDLRDGR